MTNIFHMSVKIFPSLIATFNFESILKFIQFLRAYVTQLSRSRPGTSLVHNLWLPLIFVFLLSTDPRTKKLDGPEHKIWESSVDASQSRATAFPLRCVALFFRGVNSPPELLNRPWLAPNRLQRCMTRIDDMIVAEAENTPARMGNPTTWRRQGLARHHRIH